MLFYVILFYFVLFYFVLFCFVLFCFVLFCFILFYFILFYYYLILSYLILSYLILSYLILSYLILSYFILFYFILVDFILFCLILFFYFFFPILFSIVYLLIFSMTHSQVGEFPYVNSFVHIRKVLIGRNAPWLAVPTNQIDQYEVCSAFDELGIPRPRGGGYSSMIWVGTCRWDLKIRPIFIPNFAETWDPFLYQRHKF